MDARPRTRAPYSKRVAVIGAGVSGLAAAKCLLDEGIEPVVFERAAEVGGVWNFREEETSGGGPGYRSLRTNTSKQTTAFSDFPFPANLPDFPGWADVLAYLNAYADHFNLRPHIRLSTNVEAVTPAFTPRGAGGLSGWQVTYRSTGSDQPITEMFDAVLVCSGLYHSPAMLHYPGEETFQGQILHSRSYKGPEGFEGKNIVVVGTGSSGVDIAVELQPLARHVVLSTARGAWFLPRYISGKPYDHRLNRLAALVPYKLRMRLFERLLFGEYERMGIDHAKSALGPVLRGEPLDVLRARLTVSSEITRDIAAGKIVARPAIESLEGRQVVFTDGTRFDADAIILATGYNLGFPFLAESIIAPDANMINLYKHVFHPDLPGLAFLGMCIVAGPAVPVIEMQARWVARVLAKRVALQTQAAMQEEIRARVTRAQSTGANPMRVELLDYMDDLAAEIGAKPRLAHHPTLAWQLLTGPPVAAQYRLDGPVRWKDAKKVVKLAGKHSVARQSGG